MDLRCFIGSSSLCLVDKEIFSVSRIGIVSEGGEGRPHLAITVPKKCGFFGSGKAMKISLKKKNFLDETFYFIGKLLGITINILFF